MSNTQYISIEAQLDNAMEFLNEIDGNKNAMRRRILSAVGTGAKNAVKKSYSSLLNKRSGQLYKKISKKVIRSGKAVVVQSTAHASNQVLYGYALAKGSTITARKSDYLTFKIGDKWVKKHSIKLPQKDFIVSPAERYLHSSSVKETINKQIQKELERAAKAAERKAANGK